jgi:hypothetical protein
MTMMKMMTMMTMMTVEWNRRSSSNPTKDPPNVLLHLLLMYVDRIFKLMMIQYIIILTSDYN